MADNTDDSEPEFDPIALARRNARRKAVTEIAARRAAASPAAGRRD